MNNIHRLDAWWRAWVVAGLIGSGCAGAASTHLDFSSRNPLQGAGYNAGERHFVTQGYVFGSDAGFTYWGIPGINAGLRLFDPASGNVGVLTITRADGKPFTLDSLTLHLGGQLLPDSDSIEIRGCQDSACLQAASATFSPYTGQANTFAPGLPGEVRSITLRTSKVLYQLQRLQLSAPDLPANP